MKYFQGFGIAEAGQLRYLNDVYKHETKLSVNHKSRRPVMMQDYSRLPRILSPLDITSRQKEGGAVCFT